MLEFTIHIDTVETAGASEDILEQAAARLVAAGALDPVMSLDLGTGTFSATFQVEAANVREAAQRAIDMFAGPLMSLGAHARKDAGLGGTVSAHECVADDLVESVSARHTRDGGREAVLA